MARQTGNNSDHFLQADLWGLMRARTCPAPVIRPGSEPEQIQFLLGHMSVQKTERYLGCKRQIHSAVNDRISLEQSFCSVLPA